MKLTFLCRQIEELILWWITWKKTDFPSFLSRKKYIDVPPLSLFLITTPRPCQICKSPRHPDIYGPATPHPSSIPYCVTFFKRCLFVISIIYNCLCYDPAELRSNEFPRWNLFDGLPSVGPRSNLSKHPSPKTSSLNFSNSNFYILAGVTRYDSQLGERCTYDIRYLFHSLALSKFLARSSEASSKIAGSGAGRNRGKWGWNRGEASQVGFISIYS